MRAPNGGPYRSLEANKGLGKLSEGPAHRCPRAPWRRSHGQRRQHKDLKNILCQIEARQTDVRHGGADPARLENAADSLVLGILSDVHPFNGVFALQLQKQLALGSYKTAWLLAAKLRRAITAPDGASRRDCRRRRDRDNTPHGWQGRAGHGRRRADRWRRVRGIRLGKIENLSAASLHGLVAAAPFSPSSSLRSPSHTRR